MSAPMVQIIDGAGEFHEDEMKQFVAANGVADSRANYQVVSIMGPQSSGKSTLMNHLVGSDEAAERLRGCVPSRSCTHAWQRRAAGWDLLLHALAARQ